MASRRGLDGSICIALLSGRRTQHGKVRRGRRGFFRGRSPRGFDRPWRQAKPGSLRPTRRSAGPERLRVFRSCPLITPEDARASFPKCSAIARAMAAPLRLRSDAFWRAARTRPKNSQPLRECRRKQHLARYALIEAFWRGVLDGDEDAKRATGAPWAATLAER